MINAPARPPPPRPYPFTPLSVVTSTIKAPAWAAKGPRQSTWPVPGGGPCAAAGVRDPPLANPEAGMARGFRSTCQVRIPATVCRSRARPFREAVRLFSLDGMRRLLQVAGRTVCGRGIPNRISGPGLTFSKKTREKAMGGSATGASPSVQVYNFFLNRVARSGVDSHRGAS